MNKKSITGALQEEIFRLRIERHFTNAESEEERAITEQIRNLESAMSIEKQTMDKCFGKIQDILRDGGSIKIMDPNKPIYTFNNGEISLTNLIVYFDEHTDNVSK